MLPFPIPGDLPDPGIGLRFLVSPALAGRRFTTAPPGTSSWAILIDVPPSPRVSDFIFTFHFHALEKEMVTHSSVIA